MRILGRCVAFAGTVALVVIVGLQPSSAVGAITTDANWVGGSVPLSTKTMCIATCQVYAGGATQIQYQGPISNITIVPRVGERFYVHVWAENGWSGQPSEAFRMQALLPDGVDVSILSASDVQCAITDASYVQLRNMSPAECQDPTKSGLYWNFPAVEIGAGERANYFFPVVATREISAQSMGVLTTLVRNLDGFSPNPLYSTMNVTVLPALAAPTPIADLPAGDLAAQFDTPPTSTPASSMSDSNTLAPVSHIRVHGSTLKWSAPAGVTAYVVQASARKSHWKTIGKPIKSTYFWKQAKPGKWWIRIAEVTSSGRAEWSTPVRVTLR